MTDRVRTDGVTGPKLVFGPNMAIRASIFQSRIRFDPFIGPKGSDYPMGSGKRIVIAARPAGTRVLVHCWCCCRASGSLARNNSRKTGCYGGPYVSGADTTACIINARFPSAENCGGEYLGISIGIFRSMRSAQQSHGSASIKNCRFDLVGTSTFFPDKVRGSKNLSVGNVGGTIRYFGRGIEILLTGPTP